MGEPAIDAPRFDLQALLSAHPPQRSLELHERHINPAMAAVLKTIGFDVPFVRGQGAYLFDDQGQRYIDCLGGYAVFAAGRNHPVINDAIRQALDAQLANLPGIGIFRTAPILAQQLVALAPGNRQGAPGPLDTVFFASGGAEAVDAAIKFARMATGRQGVVYCTRAYHGLTIGALSVTGNHEFREGFGPLLNDTFEIPFNDPAALERALIDHKPAAFIVEPVQGKGVNIPDAGYLARASELCKAHGTLLIADEIQTGLGRTGRWFACEHFGLVPDILVVAKALSGGISPTSAVLMSRAIHTKTFDGMSKCSKIQNTFSMNEVSMIAGLAALHVLRHEQLVERSRDVGEYLLAQMRQRLSRHEMVKEVRGLGLMIALEFERPKSLTLRLAWDAVHKVDANLFCQSIILPLLSDHRVLAQVAGHRLNVIKLIPPLVLSRTDADAIVEALDTTIAAVHRTGGPAWIIPRLGAATLRRFLPGSGSSASKAEVGASAQSAMHSSAPARG
jgi:ornithine--oxo-acid transaminase